MMNGFIMNMGFYFQTLVFLLLSYGLFFWFGLFGLIHIIPLGWAFVHCGL